MRKCPARPPGPRPPAPLSAPLPFSRAQFRVVDHPPLKLPGGQQASTKAKSAEPNAGA